MKRHATAVWQGSGKEGKGTLTTQSTTLNDTQYSFGSRFENGNGTNPEELCAAAHAGCFAMKFSFVVGNSGFVPDYVNVKCEINMENGAIMGSHLTIHAKITGISKELFDTSIADAKENCPISKLYNTTITAEAILD